VFVKKVQICSLLIENVTEKIRNSCHCIMSVTFWCFDAATFFVSNLLQKD